MKDEKPIKISESEQRKRNIENTEKKTLTIVILINAHKIQARNHHLRDSEFERTQIRVDADSLSITFIQTLCLETGGFTPCKLTSANWRDRN